MFKASVQEARLTWKGGPQPWFVVKTLIWVALNCLGDRVATGQPKGARDPPMPTVELLGMNCQQVTGPAAEIRLGRLSSREKQPKSQHLTGNVPEETGTLVADTSSAAIVNRVG
jgi:hypothetical protein